MNFSKQNEMLWLEITPDKPLTTKLQGITSRCVLITTIGAPRSFRVERSPHFTQVKRHLDELAYSASLTDGIRKKPWFLMIPTRR